jgi:hypothetical protein
LPGLILCGRCGRRMQVRYRDDGHSYFCARSDNDTSNTGASRCWSTPGARLDAAIERHVLAQLTEENLDLSLEVLRRLEADLVSVLVETYPYRGGNGNWTRYAAWNRIRDNGKVRPLKLEELFREDGAWIRYLRTACAVELRGLGATWPDEATAETDAEGKPNLPAPLEQQRFTLSATGLQLQFDPYEAGSGAQGGFTVHIPFSDLGRYLRPEWRRRLVR